MECKYCNIHEGNLIKKFNKWHVLINPNQYYLGRCSIILNRHLEDLTEISKEEQEELFSIMKKLREVLISLFGTNLFNYYSAGNIIQHLHIHFIPRYNHEVEFGGFKFKDEFWGKNHSHYPRDFKINEGLLIKIRDEIKSKL